MNIECPRAPTEFVFARNDLVAWLRSDRSAVVFEHGQYQHITKPDRPSPLADWFRRMGLDAYKQWHTNTLIDAPLYFVTEEMQRVVTAAAKELPDLSALEPSDFPSPIGFVLFGGEPIHKKMVMAPTGDEIVSEVVAVLWSTIVDQAGRPWLLLDTFEASDLGTWPTMVTKANLIAAGMPSLLHHQVRLIPFGCDTPTQEINDEARVVLSTLLLMQQTVGQVTIETPNRNAKRSCKRAGLLPEVRVVYLRRPSGSASAGDTTIDWSHQWIVGGHWRNQWYSTRGAHRPKWIAPYVKGPDDKPLIVRDTVRVLAK